MIWGLTSTDVLTAAMPPQPLTEDGSEPLISDVGEALRDGEIALLGSATFDIPQHLVRLAAYLDGYGPSDASQVVRAVIYHGEQLVAASDPVNIQADQPPGWVGFVFPAAGMLLPVGACSFGVHAGPTDRAAEFYLSPRPGGAIEFFTGTPFTDGPPSDLSALVCPRSSTDLSALYSIDAAARRGFAYDEALWFAAPPLGATVASSALCFLETIPSIQIRPNVTDDYRARLPFDVAQGIFKAAGLVRGSTVKATVGWYGNTFDPETGSNAVVRSDGPLAAMLGERVLVTRRRPVRDRTVAVYVHNERAFPDELAGQDMLLSSRAFLALADPAVDDIKVTVGILQ